jgi:hypothetical protein
MNYIGGDELIFQRGDDGTIMAGGFSVGSMLNKTGGVFTFNSIGGQKGGGVSDLFQGLVIPCGLLYGGMGHKDKDNQYADDDSDEDDVIGDKLHDELLGLAKPVKKLGTRKHRTKLNHRKSAKNTK